MKAYAKTDVGAQRNTNQDFVYFSLEPVGKLPNVFIVADGMGGHKAGDYASRYSVETFLDSVRNSAQKDTISILQEGISVANESLIARAKESIEREGMGTTFVVTTVIDHSLYIANVGDSRLYLIGSDNITQVTRDHSLVEFMIDNGEIDRKDARLHEKKNIITKAIGADTEVAPDIFEVEYDKFDKVLLCSDGLSNMMEDDEIMRIANGSGSVEERVLALIDKANENGGKDNISVVLLEPGDEEVTVC